MSKIALTPNASGTGTFTIAAPNSNTDRTLTLPDEAGTVVTTGSYVAGITEADIWRLTTSKSGDGDITSGLERVDTYSQGTIGTGMTESSGVFSFPSTGLYLIIATGNFNNGGNDTADLAIQATTNNSTYQTLAIGGVGLNSTTVRGQNVTINALFDVTNISNDKVKFNLSSMGSGTQANADTNTNRTHFTFIRLGDT